jgi:hypothetical protein
MKHIRGNFSPDELRRLLVHTAKAVAGQEPDTYGLSLKFWSAMSYSLFESIFAAFLAKSKGLNDDLGNSWKDLAPETKAYNRPDARTGLTLYDNRAVNTPDLRVRPTLPPSINRQWGGRWYGLYVHLFTAIGDNESKKVAGASTWEHFKALGYPTLIGLTQNMKLPILNKTGALQRSLFPAPLKAGIYVPIDKNQIFRSEKGRLVLGTKRPGITNIDKQRPLWPKNISKWIDKATAAGRDAVYEALPNIIERL